MKKLLLASCLLALSACANQDPVKFGDYFSDKDIPSAKKGQGTVVLYALDTTDQGYNIFHTFQINNVERCLMKGGSFATLSTPPGATNLATVAEKDTPLSFDLKAGETKYVRATLNISKMSALNNGAQIGGLLGLAVAYAVSGDAKKNDVFLDVVPKQTAIRELYTTRKVTNCKKPS